MAKLIAAINMTLDGYCDHTEMIADEESHQHYNDLLRSSGTLIYGRITYQLMERNLEFDNIIKFVKIKF